MTIILKMDFARVQAAVFVSLHQRIGTSCRSQRAEGQRRFPVRPARVVRMGTTDPRPIHSFVLCFPQPLCTTCSTDDSPPPKLVTHGMQETPDALLKEAAQLIDAIRPTQAAVRRYMQNPAQPNQSRPSLLGVLVVWLSRTHPHHQTLERSRGHLL